MAYSKWVLIAALTLASSACVRDGDEFIVPLGHPADAGARSGAVLVGSSALEPELQTVKPQIDGARAPVQQAPSSGAHQHKH